MKLEGFAGRQFAKIQFSGRYLRKKGRQPSLIILGAQKAGTSSLFSYLNQHPSFCGSSTKEVHYFDLNFDRPQSWYEAHFTDSASTVPFEASPYYLFHPLTPVRIKETVPEARFVILLRDPVKRAISHYHHEVALKHESLSLIEAVQAEESRLEGCDEALLSGSPFEPHHQWYSYISRSRYSAQIERWFSVFPRSRFLFIISEEMNKEPQAAVDAVSEFMNVPAAEIRDFKPQNQRKYGQSDTVEVDLIRSLLKNDTLRLPGLIGRSPAWINDYR